jgi:hypothetical protein
MKRGSQLDEAAQPAVAAGDPARLERLVRIEEALAIPAVSEAFKIVVGGARRVGRPSAQASASRAATSVSSISASLCAAVRNISSMREGGKRMPRSSMRL